MSAHRPGPPRFGPPGWRPVRAGRLLQPVVLLALLDGPTHGYELIKRASGAGPGDGPDAGGVYRALRAMERDGFVRSSWEQAESGPARRQYEITDEGRALLDGWIAHLKARRDALDEMITRYEGQAKRKE